MTPTEVLEAAKQKIAQGWCQGSFGKSATDQAVSIDHACKWCADGALYAAMGDRIGSITYFRARDFVHHAIGDPVSIWDWNDAPGRTQAEVLAAFDKAIQLSKEAA